MDTKHGNGSGNSVLLERAGSSTAVATSLDQNSVIVFIGKSADRQLSVIQTKPIIKNKSNAPYYITGGSIVVIGSTALLQLIRTATEEKSYPGWLNHRGSIITLEIFAWFYNIASSTKLSAEQIKKFWRSIVGDHEELPLHQVDQVLSKIIPILAVSPPIAVFVRLGYRFKNEIFVTAYVPATAAGMMTFLTNLNLFTDFYYGARLAIANFFNPTLKKLTEKLTRLAFAIESDCIPGLNNRMREILQQPVEQITLFSLLDAYRNFYPQIKNQVPPSSRLAQAFVFVIAAGLSTGDAVAMANLAKRLFGHAIIRYVAGSSRWMLSYRGLQEGVSAIIRQIRQHGFLGALKNIKNVSPYALLFLLLATPFAVAYSVFATETALPLGVIAAASQLLQAAFTGNSIKAPESVKLAKKLVDMSNRYAPKWSLEFKSYQEENHFDFDDHEPVYPRSCWQRMSMRFSICRVM